LLNTMLIVEKHCSNDFSDVCCDEFSVPQTGQFSVTQIGR